MWTFEFMTESNTVFSKAGEWNRAGRETESCLEASKWAAEWMDVCARNDIIVAVRLVKL